MNITLSNNKMSSKWGMWYDSLVTLHVLLFESINQEFTLLSSILPLTTCSRYVPFWGILFEMSKRFRPASSQSFGAAVEHFLPLQQNFDSYCWCPACFCKDCLDVRTSIRLILGWMWKKIYYIIYREILTPIDNGSELFHKCGLGLYPTKPKAKWNAPQPPRVKYVNVVAFVLIF